MEPAARVKKTQKPPAAGGLTGMDKLVLVLTVLYCLSPFDILPDVIPVVGFLDDLTVILAALGRFAAGFTGGRDSDDPAL